MTTRLRFFSSFASHFDSVRGFLLIFVGAVVIAGVVSWVLGVLSSFYLPLGAVFACIIVVSALWLTNLVKQSPSGTETGSVLAVLALALFTVSVAGGWVSFMVHAANPETYSVPAEYSPGTFVDLYMLTFLDLIPGIDLFETLHLKPSIESRNLIGGLPILAFKIFVLYRLFDVFLFWLKRRTELPSRTAS